VTKIYLQKNNKQKNLEKKIIFVYVLQALPTPSLFSPFISTLVWIAGCWNIPLTSLNPKNNCCFSRIFGARFGLKRLPFVPIQTMISFLSEAAQNFEVFLKKNHN
jgi:hypothetical protein